ncbi:type II toxin-antitoxin system Phd/YefM family antitoxin [bacterium]|nr:type II toxin-antitoxin system Phd/YefM family antitoxin [bacterium]
MKTLSLSEAKMKLSELIRAVSNLDEEIVITKNGSPQAVIINPAELDSLRETIAVRSDKELVADIKKGLKSLKNKKSKLYTLDELFDD